MYTCNALALSTVNLTEPGNVFIVYKTLHNHFHQFTTGLTLYFFITFTTKNQYEIIFVKTKMNTITISEVGHDEFLLAERCSKQYLISLMAPDIFFSSIKQVVIPQATMNKRHRVEKIKLTSLSPMTCLFTYVFVTCWADTYMYVGEM